MDPYLEKYVNAANAVAQSDFLRNYQRAMGQQTAQNYAATGGGYSSANQLGYDDLQRYYNHYANDLYAQGLNQASQMADQEYNMLTGALGSYGNAYNLGKEYSENEQYNKLTDYEKEVFPIFFDIANAMGILQISYLISQGEASEEDRF